MIRGQVNAFNQAVVPLQLSGPGGQIEAIDAIVDTGFDGFLAVTADVAARLQLPFGMTRFYELGDGNKVEFDIHLATVLWDGGQHDVEALVTQGGALLGMSMLRAYHLFIDVIDGGDVVIEARL
jgi:clan AA aspartic protease